MDVRQMREELKKKYPNSTRVANWPDAQVIAVYNRLKSKGQIGR